MGVFTRFATACARWSGHPVAFAGAFLLVAGWLAVGPLFGWSNEWQLVINTATTIITFLMVFLIQNTQARDIEAIHVKLDALVLNTKGASNSLMDLEARPEGELRKLQLRYQALAGQARKARPHRRPGRPRRAGRRGGAYARAAPRQRR